MSLEDLKDQIMDTYYQLDEQIPFFPVLLGVLVLAILGVLFLGIFGGTGALTTVTIEVENNAGVALRGAEIRVSIGSDTQKLTTDREGKVSFEAPLQEAVDVVVSKENYETLNKTIFVTEENLSLKLTLNPPLFASKEVTLSFVGPDRQKLKGKEVIVRLSCTGPGVFENPEFIVRNGELTVTPPENCGSIIVVANADGYETANATVLGKEEIIRLEGIPVPTGRVEIITIDDDTNTFVDGLNVKFTDAFGGFTGNIGFTSFGRVLFPDVEIGEYTITVSDPKQEFGTETTSVNVRENNSQKIEIRVSKDIKLKAKIIVKELNTETRIENVIVTLYDSLDKVVDETTTDSSGEANFAISEHGTYSFIAAKQDYFPSERQEFNTRDYDKGSEEEFEAEIEPCSIQTCGSLIIRVIDEDGIAVENAAVRLLDEQGFVLTTFNARPTDFNGFVQKFLGLPQGTYIALAQKFPAAGQTEPFELNPLEENSIELIMEIGHGSVLITAVDNDERPVDFADATLFTDYDSEIGTIALDAQGTGILSEVKADKKVYVIVEKPGFSSYITIAKQIFKDDTIEFDTVLQRELLGEKPTVELIGVFNKQGRNVTNLSQGQTYDARFIINVPTDADFSEMGLFVRVGEKESLEKDKIWINEINAPTSSHIRGSTFEPPKGNIELTNGNAKWASIQWDEPREGRYEIGVSFKVKEGTTRGTYLPLFYRAWGIDSSKYLRDPFDEELGEAQDSNDKDEIYAESYEKPFFEGLDELCSGNFCFGHRLLDETQGIYLEPPYNVKTFSPYTLEFTITNDSQTIHDNANIKIRNTQDTLETSEDVLIKSYTFTNADSQTFSSTDEVFEIGSIFMGDFRNNKTVQGEMALEPKTDNGSSLEFKIISDQTIVFDDFVRFRTFFDSSIEIETQPETLGAYIPIDMNIIATLTSGEDAGFGLDDAIVVVKIINPDKSETTVFGTTTNLDGLSRLTIPASEPGTKIIIKVEKPGLGFSQVERTIDDKVVRFDPEEIEIKLNRQTREENTEILTIENLIPRKIEIQNIRTTGNFRGLLDEERIDNFLAQYIGKRFDKETLDGIEILSALGPEAEFLDQPKRVKGKLLIDFGLEDDESVTWVQELPFETIINLAELPVNEGCIVISINDWEDATLESRASIEFEIQNNCINEQGERLPLDNLQAKLDWFGKDGIVGQVELTITDPNTGFVASEILQEGLWSRFAETLEPELIYPGRLTFVPKGGSLGKRAEFNVNIDAQLVTNAGPTFVGASNDISADIIIINLEQCIEITPDPQEGLVIDRRQDDTEFTIDTSECGPIDLDFRFCGGESGDGCRGGTSEGGINVRPWGYTNVREDTKTVNVERQQIPGFYGITIEARPEGGSWRKITEMDLVIEPEEGEYFTLDKYDFVVIGQGSQDSTILTNQMLMEDVSVKAGACDWEDVSKDPNFGGAIPVALGAGAAAYGLSLLLGDGLVLGTFCPVCFVIGAGIAILITALMTLFGDDPCDESITETLKDYVLNLTGTDDPSNPRYIPPDALAILMTDNSILGEWNIGIADVKADIGRNGRQTVGVVFKNLNVVQDEPVYSIATMTATEHVHGDPIHKNAKVRCSSSNFGMFWINPGTCSETYDTQYQQKFHLKFKVAEELETLPPVDFDTFACQSGITIGRTGPGALPRTKLNWNWNESTGGITSNQCDASNPDFVYCDGTQFTIEVNKKVNSLYEFLQGNNFELGCPNKVVDGETIAFPCDLKTTESYFEEPALVTFVKDYQNVVWTQEIQDIQALENLLLFDAYLMKDGYSEDFYKDFSDYYTNIAFEDTPSFFTSLIQTNSGEEFGFNKLMDEGLFVNTRKYVDSSELPAAGLYGVEIAAYFGEDDWRFFDDNGDPMVSIAIVVYRKNSPAINSPLYSIPFDGLVGIEGNSFDRQGYGSAYFNSDEPIVISNEITPTKTYSDSGSNPITKVNISENRNLYSTNTSITTRGMLLRVESLTGQTSTIQFQPVQGTPVLMKVTQEDLTEEKFSAFYSVIENDVPIDLGNTFTYWNGAGQCFDFTGIPVTEKFFEKPDRAATPEDNLLDWDTTYAVDWTQAVKTGDVYLRTIVYTDPLKDTVMKVIQGPSDLEFLSADESGNIVGLNGVAGMPFNNFAGGTQGMVNSLQDIYSLVEQEQVCITNTGSKTQFWWNPQVIYDADGAERNVSDFSNTLEAGTTCIG